MIRAAHLTNPNRLPFQVADGSDPLGPEQLEATNMNATENDERLPRVDGDEQWPREVPGDIDLAGHDGLGKQFSSYLDVLDLGETLGREEFLSQVHRGAADGDAPRQPDLRDLGRRLRGGRTNWHPEKISRECPRTQAKETRGRDPYCSVEELSAAPAPIRFATHFTGLQTARMLSFHLLLEFLEKPPVRALSDELLGATLEDPGFAEP